MKKNKRIFISVMCILIFAAILIGMYFINKKPENFNLRSVERYSGLDELVKNGIIGSNGEYVVSSIKSADYVKNFYIEKLKGKSYLRGNLKALNTSKIAGPFTPVITKDQLAAARADHQTWTYVSGISAAEGSLIAGTIKAVFNLITEGDNEALKNLGIQIGIGLLSVGLATIGLGSLGSAISAMFGGDSGPPPIDYNLIKKIVVEALKDSSLSNSMDLINTNIKYAINDSDSYNTLKYSLYTKCLSGYSNSQNIDCIIKPNPNEEKLFLDLNIVNTSGDIENIHKRTKLSEWLKNSKINEVIKGQYGKQFIIQTYSKSIKSTIALYPLFNIINGMTLTYYQELMLVDTILDSNGNFRNPWLNSLIGDSRSIGMKQPLGTLLGEMQNICIEVFDYIKITCKLFNDSLRFYSTDHDKFLYTWTNYWCADNEGIIPEEFYKKYASIYGTSSISSKGDQYFGFSVKDKEYLMSKDDYKNNKTSFVRPMFIDILLDYLNYPLSQLQTLKKIAGIKWLAGEQNFNIQEYARGGIQPSNLNTQAIYDENGGYPFGISAPSYKEALDSIKNPKNYDNIEKTNRFKTFCSPDIFIENSSLNNSTCLNYKPSLNKVNASIFNNIKGQDKIYNDNMICEDPYSDTIKSCLKPGISPGKQGEVTSNSRYTYCYNSKTGKTSKLLTKETLNCDNKEALYDLSSYVNSNSIKLSPFKLLTLQNFDLNNISDNGSAINSKISLKDESNILEVVTTIFTNNKYCKDVNVENCKYWANNGECSKNPLFMLDKCKFSCGACGEKDIILRIDWRIFDNNKKIIDSNNALDLKFFPSCLMIITTNNSYSNNLKDYFPRIPNNNPNIFNSKQLISKLTNIRSDFIESNIIMDDYEYDSFINAKINVSYKETSDNYRKTYFIFLSISCIKNADNYINVKIKGVKIIDERENMEIYLEGRITPGFDKLSFWINNEWVDCITEPPTTQYPITTQYPTTQFPTTQYPTTQYPTTQFPTTQFPTTQYPTTQFPTTQFPTTQGICNPSYKNTCTSELLNNGYCVSQYGSCGIGNAWCNENSLWTSKCGK